MWWLLAIGCDGDRGGGADEGPACVETETAIGLDDPTAIGVTGNDLAALVDGEFAHALAYADGSTSTIALAFAVTGEVWEIDSEPAPSTGGTEPAIYAICEDRVEIGVSFGFATGDGAFDESWAERLSATVPGTATVHHPLDLDGLNGSFDLVPFVLSPEWDELRAWVTATVTGPGLSTGAIEGQASGHEDCDEGETCAAWAEQVPVATWGTDESTD